MLKCGAFLVESVDEKIQNTRGYYIQIQFAMYALKVDWTYIEESYDKDNYSVRKCLRGECKKIDDEAPVEI